MSNRSALVVTLLIGVATGIASCRSDDDTISGAGGSEAGMSGGGASGRGGGSVAGGAGGAVTTTPSGGGMPIGAAGSGGVVGTTSIGGSSQSAVAGTSAMAGRGGAGGFAGTAGISGTFATAGTAGTLSADPLTSLCTKICADQATVVDAQFANCSFGNDCMDVCTVPASYIAASQHLAMVACMAANLTTADYFCSDKATIPSARGPAPTVNQQLTSTCAAEICAFTCADDLFFDGNLATACACGI